MFKFYSVQLHWLSVILPLFFSLPLLAEESANPEKRNFNLYQIEEYRGAETIKRDFFSDSEYLLPLDKLKRLGRDWQPETFSFIQGEVSRSLYKLNRNTELNSVFEHYSQAIKADASDILYECAGRNCGSSNAWANNFFREYRLYGADDSQFLIVTKQKQPFTLYQVLYINRRGAGDIFVRLDRIHANKEVAELNDDQIALQTEINNFSKIRRYVESVPASQKVIALITANKQQDIDKAILRGQEHIKNIQSSLGSRLASKVIFINLASFGEDEYGEDLVTLLKRD